MAFTPAEETLIAPVSLDDFVVRNKAATFMMRVWTDEHADLGILKGDLLVVERGVQPANHTLVIQETTEGWSLCRINTGPYDHCIVVRGVVRTYD